MARRISLGSYYAAVSPIHALDPRVKIAITLLYMVSCLIARGAPALAVAALLALATCTLARIPLGRFVRQLRPLAAVLVVTSLVNLLFADVGDVDGRCRHHRGRRRLAGRPGPALADRGDHLR